MVASSMPKSFGSSREYYGPKVNRVECLPLEDKNEGGSRLGNHLETSGGLKVVIKCRNRSYP
jgi:hypothetical protein